MMSWGLSLFAVFCFVGISFLLLGIKLLFGLCDFVSSTARRSVRHRFPPSTPVAYSTQSYNGSTVARICWSLLPSTAVLAVFVGLSGAMNREWDTIIVVHQSPQRQGGVTLLDSNTAQKVSLQKKLDEKAESRPEWIKEEDSSSNPSNRPLFEGDVQKIVLSSRLWSTEAEAIQDLEKQAVERIRADFLQHHPGLLDPKNFKVDGIVKTMVKQRYVEQIEQDFGKFTAPMYRAWWQIEISPVVRTELYPQWKSASIQNRIIVVGIILALVTLLASSVELYTKLPPETQPTAARFLALGAVPLVYSAMELYFAARLMS